MSDVLRHVRHALRSLRRSPVFTLSAILTLAVCIGANVAVFSTVDRLLLRPLPYPDADRIVLLEKGAAFGRNMLRMDVAPWVRDMRAFSSVGLFTSGTLNLAGGGEPEHVKATMVSPGFFAAIGLRPTVGRVLRAEDHEKGGAYAAVLSDRLWRRMFGADRSLPGRTILVNGRSTVVAGVMPPGFDFPDRSDLWVPATIAETPFIGGLRFRFIARLRPEATVAQARAEGEVAGRRNLTSLPRTYSFDVVPLQEVLSGPIRPTLLLFLAAVALVLLIGCANVTNLVFARVTARRAEMAIRAALGAGRSALIRQALVEIGLVSLAGGVAGLALAKTSLSTFLALMPADVAGLDRVGVDARAAAFALALSMVATLLVGLLPAWRIGRMDLQETTRGTGHGLRTGRRYLPRIFVVAEMALALVLSAGAALLVRSFVQLANVGPGLQPQHVLTMTVSTMNRTYRQEPGLSPTERSQMEFRRSVGTYRQILERVRSIPAVDDAAAINDLPMDARLPMRAEVRSENVGPILSMRRIVTPGYFSTMKIPIVAGQDFSDQAADHPTVIISRNLAHRLWGRDWTAGGRVHLLDSPDEPWWEVIGVAGDVRSVGPEHDAPPEVYLRFGDGAWDPVMSIVVRAKGDPRQIAGAVRDEIRAASPSAPVYRVRPMPEVVAATIAVHRTSMLVLGLFAACAVLLAAMGVYGVTSYLVGLRTREFGVRVALGARSTQVLGAVLRQGAIDAAIAASIGVAGALALGRVMKSFLVNVAPTDPLVLAATSVGLVAIGIISSLAPARRAASVDPALTLRAE